MSRETDMEQLETLLTGHREKLQRVIDLAAEGGHWRGSQLALEGLAIRARSYLRRVEATLKRPTFHPTHGDLGLWGPNGMAPTIDDILSSAEFHASFVPMEINLRADGGSIAA